MLTINEIEVSYHHDIPAPFWKKIDTSEDAAKILFDHWDKDTIGLHESFKVLLLISLVTALPLVGVVQHR